MEQAVASTGSTRGEVAFFDKAVVHATQRQVPGDPASGGATPDNDYVGLDGQGDPLYLMILPVPYTWSVRQVKGMGKDGT
jgi:hypothetical protein